MSFLDNLENNLKSLEAGHEGETASREQKKLRSERARQMAVEPWAEQLRKGEFTKELMSCAAREGHRLRTKVYITWLGSSLRLAARDKRMDLRPHLDGVEVSYSDESGERARVENIDLTGSPDQMIQDWLSS